MPSTPVYNSRGEPAREPMTFEEFLEWVDEDTRAEWVNGRVELMSPTSERHQDITMFLSAVLLGYVQSRKLGKITSGPYTMRLRGAKSAREPDVFFIARERLFLVGEKYLDGPADLAVEVVSPGSQTTDRKAKFAEYQTAGVREYWLIDPERLEAIFYVLDENRRFKAAAVDADGRYRSSVLESFSLPVRWLWDPPQLIDALRHLGVA